MAVITAESLMSLEQYAKARKDFRAKVLAHKKNRTVHLGEHITLVFEDEFTMRYQIQEMLRVERIFEEEGIRDEPEADAGKVGNEQPLTVVSEEWRSPELNVVPRSLTAAP